MNNKPLTPSTLKQIRKNGLILLIDPEKPAWAIVNKLGLEISELCDGNNTEFEIAGLIASHYAKPIDTVATDISKFLRKLENAGLIHYGEIPSAEWKSAADWISPISSVAFEVTEKCNLRCAHCFEDAGRSVNPDPSTVEITDWIDKFAHIPDVTVNLTGGEFFTRADWRELMEHLIKRNMTGVILTNGTLFDTKTANDLSELVKNNKFTIQVSLDGPDPETNDPVRGKGSFDSILAGIMLLKNFDLTGRMVISFTPNKINAHSIDKMLDLVLELGTPKFHISLLNRMGRAEDSWDYISPSTEDMVEFYDKLHQRSEKIADRLFISGDYCSMLHKKIQKIAMPPTIGCRLGVDLKVDILGDVYPCTPMSFDKKYSLGNIRDLAAEDIQKSQTLRAIRELFIPRIENSDCRECAWKCFCGGGCMVRSEINYSTIYNPDDLCGLAQELYLRTFFREADAKRRTHAEKV